MLVQIIIFPHFGRDRNRSVHKPNPVQNHKLFSIRSNGVRARRVWSHRYSSRLPQPRLATLAVCVCVCRGSRRFKSFTLHSRRLGQGDMTDCCNFISRPQASATAVHSICHSSNPRDRTMCIVMHAGLVSVMGKSGIKYQCQIPNIVYRWLQILISNLQISRFTEKNKTYIISNIYHRLKTVNNIRVVTLISSRNQVSTLSQFRMYCFSYKKTRPR